MNNRQPLPLLIFVSITGLGIMFVKSVWLNSVLVLIGMALLLLLRVKPKPVFLALLISLPAAFGTWWSYMAFSTYDNWHIALIYTSRLYAFLMLGLTVTLAYTPREILFSLRDYLKLSDTFTYGILAAFNLLPRVRHQIKIIQYGAAMRGIKYHLWSPQLYFRAILTAINWAQDLSEGMTSHGFSEGFPRTNIKTPLSIPLVFLTTISGLTLLLISLLGHWW